MYNAIDCFFSVYGNKEENIRGIFRFGGMVMMHIQLTGNAYNCSNRICMDVSVYARLCVCSDQFE